MTEPSICGGDVALCQIILTTCYFFLPVTYILLMRIVCNAENVNLLLFLVQCMPEPYMIRQVECPDC